MSYVESIACMLSTCYIYVVAIKVSRTGSCREFFQCGKKVWKIVQDTFMNRLRQNCLGPFSKLSWNLEVSHFKRVFKMPFFRLPKSNFKSHCWIFENFNFGWTNSFENRSAQTFLLDRLDDNDSDESDVSQRSRDSI